MRTNFGRINLIAIISLAAASITAAAGIEPSTERGKSIDELFAIFNQESKSTAADHAASKASSHPMVKAAAKKSETKQAHSLAAANSKHQVASSKSPDSHLVAVSHTNGAALISASLDRPGSPAKYHNGDHMILKLEALTDCNVLVLDYDSKSTVTQLYPNKYDSSALLHAGETVEIGGETSKYNLAVNGNGREHIFIYAYPAAQAPLAVAMAPIADTPFRSAQLSPEQYKRLVSESIDYAGTAPTKAAGERGVSIQPKEQNASAHPVAKAGSSKIELDYEIAP